MWIVHVVTVLLFVVFGILLMNGKGAFLIAGYNTASKREKEKYDEKALCRFMGKSMFALAACGPVLALGDIIGSPIPYWIGMGLFLCIIVFILVYANTGNRFRK